MSKVYIIEIGEYESRERILVFSEEKEARAKFKTLTGDYAKSRDIHPHENQDDSVTLEQAHKSWGEWAHLIEVRVK